MNLLQKICMWIIALLIAVALFVTAVRADMGFAEIQVSGQPEKLIIRLGAQWDGSAVAVPQPDKSALTSSSSPPPPSLSPSTVNKPKNERTQNPNNVSIGLLVAVTIGLIAAVITLSELWAHRKKKTFSSNGYKDN